MSISNPNKLVNVEQLNYFKGKTDNAYAAANHTQALTAGGTGGSYANFKALADAIGSGGSVTNVTDDFKTDVVMENNFTLGSHVYMCIYEKRYAIFQFEVVTADAIAADTTIQFADFPTYLYPKLLSSASNQYGIHNINIYGNCKLRPFKDVPAGTTLTLNYFYILDTKYDPS